MKQKTTAAPLKATPHVWLKAYLMCALLCVSLSARAVNYYVSEDGNNSNNGTSPETPFRTLQHAHNQTAPGDVVYIMNGTYTPDQGADLLRITRSGNADGYITYRNMPGHTPVLYVAKEKNCWNAILIDNASYIIIEGLELKGDNDRITLAEGEARHDHYFNGGRDWTYLSSTNTNGIYIRGNSSANPVFGPTHIIIRNNQVHKFPGGGIGTRIIDYVTVDDNIVHSNAWYSIYANSGISIFNPWNSDENDGFKIFVRRNIAYRNETYVKWEHRDWYSDGNGIIIDNTTNSQINRPAYEGRIRVENNVSYENGGSGIHGYTARRTEIVNNTVYNNALSTRQTGYYNIGAHASADIIIRNNISSFASGRSTAWHNDNGNNQNVVYDHNIYHNGGTPRVMGTNDNRLDPDFVNVGQRNFQLQPSSPAINTGSASLAPDTDFAGVSRPQGGGFDRGAYEFEGQPGNPPGGGFNLIANGEFDNGMNGWWTWVNSAQSASGGVVTDAGMSGPNAFRYSITDGGSAPWQVQLGTYTPVNVENGKTYTVTFQSRAAGNRSIRFTVRLGIAPHTEYTAASVNLTTDNQTFSHTFTSSVSDPAAQLSFDAGGSDHDVWIDAVTMVEQIAQNAAPVLAPIADQSGTVGVPLTFTASATDADAGQTLTFSLEGAPAGASIHPTTGVFTYTPTAAGTFTFTVRVTDNAPEPLSAQQTLTLTVTAPPPPAALTFFRALNLNGPALTVDGKLFEASSTAPDFTYTGNTFTNQGVPLTPPTDINRSLMLRSSIWGGHARLNLQRVPSGTYEFYIYVWEDNNPATFSLFAENQTLVSNYVSGPAGRWEKLGPFRLAVTDGELNIRASGGHANLSGLEIYRVGEGATPPPLPGAYVRALNLNGPSVNVDGFTFEDSRSVAQFSFEGRAFSNTTTALTPAVPASLASLLRSSLYLGGNPGLRLRLEGVPEGTYDVYLYNWEDNNAITFSLFVEGQAVLRNFSSGPAGSWRILGPYRTAITDGALDVYTTGGSANLSGLLVRDVNSSARRGIAEAEATADSGLSVYPVPTDGVFHAEFVNPQRGPVSVRVINLQGRTLAQPVSEQAEAGKRYRLRIDGGQWAQGMYLLQVQTAAGTEQRKVLLTR